MKTAYKIYVTVVHDGVYQYESSNTVVLKSPDFESEQEAESWLNAEVANAEPIPDDMSRYKRYYFIKKTLIQ